MRSEGNHREHSLFYFKNILRGTKHPQGELHGDTRKNQKAGMKENDMRYQVYASRFWPIPPRAATEKLSCPCTNRSLDPSSITVDEINGVLKCTCHHILEFFKENTQHVTILIHF